MNQKPQQPKALVTKDNRYASIIYNKPIVKKNDKFFTRLSNRMKQRKYYKEKVKPVIDELKYGDKTFTDLYEFADFIKIIEFVFFFHNCDGYRQDEIDQSIKLFCYSKLEDKERLLVVQMPELKVNFKIKLYRDIHGEEMIDIASVNNFGRNLTSNIYIKDGEFDCPIGNNEYNLYYNIQKILYNEMSKLFKKYYEYSIELDQL